MAVDEVSIWTPDDLSKLSYLAVTYFTRLIAENRALKALPCSLFKTEFGLAVQKHPPQEWAEMHPADMHRELLREVDELNLSLWLDDLDGEHGIIREAVHVQVVAQRIIDEMIRRQR